MLKIKDENIKLTSLQKKMLAALTLPMTENCPSSLRYELAKYDSDDVEDAYGQLYELYKNDKITRE